MHLLTADGKWPRRRCHTRGPLHQAIASMVIGIIAAVMLLVSYAGEPTTEASPQVESRGNAVRVVPVLGSIEPLVFESVARRWEQENPQDALASKPVQLTGVEIVALQRADCLLDASRPGNIAQMPENERPVYLVHAFARPIYWKLTTHHLLVLVKRGDGLKELLHFSGGGSGRGISYRFENIGSSGKRKVALVIEDYACGNHQSRTRLHMFCYDKKQDSVVEVFDAVVEHSYSPTGGSEVAVHFDSDCSFRDSGGDVKDFVVLTRLQVYPARCQDPLLVEMETVLHWDGERYAGELKVPGALGQ